MTHPQCVPSVAETLKHPAFPSVIWDLVPDQHGLAPVAEGRGGPLKISWEIHGKGPIKLVFIMGLAGQKTAWQRQTLHFGHERRDEYSVLILDNRGIGDSDKPLMRYSTSDMALDLAEVLVHIGWLPTLPLPAHHTARTLHVVGISLGGMIAQELAVLVPAAVASLSLICTAAAIENTTTVRANLTKRASLLIPKSVDRSVRDTAGQLFAPDWLAAADDAHLPDPATTPFCNPPPPPPPSTTAAGSGSGSGARYQKFDSNAQRFVAQEMHKRLDAGRFTLKGFLLQLIAAGWHHKSAAQLRALADRVGRERILVMHGTRDEMISVPHGRKLIEYLEPGAGLIVEEMGHAPIAERWAWFNEIIAERCKVGEQLSGNE
ncbi:alpha/beta-hydrolase [Trichocladium antarcticum]|uniref:Alpha/beta-hydrolase n=1 Tax=Trichocladium antarcticum TaxID=1450529 RepID=A0AAN6UHD2_9PEZI|nr:alpha/beta-hydrolase [Trichocladium antarcticum]